MSSHEGILQALCEALDGLQCYIVEEECSGGPCVRRVSTSKQVTPTNIACNETSVRFGLSSQKRAMLVEPTEWQWRVDLTFGCQVDTANIMERFKSPIYVHSVYGDQKTRTADQAAPLVGLLEELRPQPGLDPTKASRVTLLITFSEDF